MQALELGQVAMCFHCHCPPEQMLVRVAKRAAASGRSDDNEATAATIISRYEKTCLPVIEAYR